MKLSREASYFQTGSSLRSVSLTVGRLWTIQMTPIGQLGKMASTMRPRGTPSMRNRSALWRKTSRMIGHPTWTRFGDKRARLSTSNALQPGQHAHKDMEFGTIASSFGLEGWVQFGSKVPSQAELVRFVPQSFQSRSLLPFLAPLFPSVLAQESTKLTKCHRPTFQCWNMIERFSSHRLL